MRAFNPALSQRCPGMVPARLVRIWRLGMAGFFKGKKHSDETKLKISAATKGERNPYFGKKHSDETKLKMSAARKRNLSFGEKGERHPNFGEKLSDEQKLKISALEDGFSPIFQHLDAAIAGGPLHGHVGASHAFKPCSIVKYVGASPAKRPCPGAIDHTSYIEAVIIHPGARNSVGTYVQEIIPNQIKSYEKIIPPPSLEEQDVFM